MGCCITKRRASVPQGGDITCNCGSEAWKGRLRWGIFIQMNNALASMDLMRSAYAGSVFWCIFKLKTIECKTCFEPWVSPENLTSSDKALIRIHFLEYAELFTSLRSDLGLNCTSIERSVLSGMVIFRTELLHILLEVSNDDAVIHPFLRHMVYWESVIRKRVTGNPACPHLQPLHAKSHFQKGNVSEEMKKTHTWWTDDFVDSENLNANGEYEFTD